MTDTHTEEVNVPGQNKRDGRLLRSERSRGLIIDAMIALVEEGFLIPTAQQIAERADVGIRSVFRHFDDMDSIFETVNTLILEETAPLFTGGDRTGTLDVRILHAIEQLTHGYESAKNFVLSGRIRRWNTPVIEKNYAVNQRRLQKELEDWIPEILTLSEDKKQSAYALASFDYWHRLRVDQTVSQDSCIAITSNQLSQVFSSQ